MKVFRNKKSGSLLFVDGDKWKTNTMIGWYKFKEGTMINHITSFRQQGWEKIGVKLYYEKVLS